MPTEVWITGIGLISCLGEGVDAHFRALTDESFVPPIETEKFAPFLVHPMTALDLDRQIPRKSDQRQMETWQRIGTYAAGLALDDAGIAKQPALLGKTDMIVAAGGGERDTAVDNEILTALATPGASDAIINEKLMGGLRPTLFLAQLSNLLAGNISIVHNVTGSSRTFMGEELAGITAVETAARRIAAGQSARCLVGGAYSAERVNLHLNFSVDRLLWTGAPASAWARAAGGGGMILGSVAAFLVLEARPTAEARGARAYARLGTVASGRSRRGWGEARASAAHQFAECAGDIAGQPAAAYSSAVGTAVTNEEKEFFASLRSGGSIGAVRALSGHFGSSVEADFPALVAAAAITLSRGGIAASRDRSGFETGMVAVPRRILAVSWGHWRGEGMGVVAAVDEAGRRRIE